MTQFSYCFDLSLSNDQRSNLHETLNCYGTSITIIKWISSKTNANVCEHSEINLFFFVFKSIVFVLEPKMVTIFNWLLIFSSILLLFFKYFRTNSHITRHGLYSFRQELSLATWKLFPINYIYSNFPSFKTGTSPNSIPKYK